MADLRQKDNLQDVQGIIIRGYGELPEARYLILGVRDAAAARRWVGTLPVTHGGEHPSRRAVNVALTHTGLSALGVESETLETFAQEFREGMTAKHRSRILGDSEASDPESWAWGGPAGPPVHVLLMLFAADAAELDTLHVEVSGGFGAGGVELLRLLPDAVVLRGADPACAKEHFGFCDSISQPFIAGLGKPAPEALTVRDGEFVLGYPNEYGRLTERPLVRPEHDPAAVLPDDAGGSGARDLGMNGTYLVFRQLHQDVCGFWRYLEAATRGVDGASLREDRIRLAAKMVGRWPSGAPLVLSPDSDHPELRADNTFLYHHADAGGLRCPLGAHVRRTNPRDALGPDPGSQKSIAVNKRHQLLRRGRAYGPPVAASMDPDEIMRGDGAGERGLHFICLGANLARQFEFVQHSWCNSPKFDGLYDDVDPLVGDRGAGALGSFTEPAHPVRRRVGGMPRFVTVRGGAYFFLPGLRALRYLASPRAGPT